MKVLVVGGLGVIGRAVTALFAKHPEHTVSVADVIDTSEVSHRLDVRDSESVASLVADIAPDVIVNLAAWVSFPAIRADLRAASMVNLVGSLNILEAARASGVRRVVFGSSKAVYGHITGVHAHPEYRPVPETHVLAPRNPYDALKVAAEITGHEFADLHGMDFIALRFGTIYGPGKTARHGYSALFSRFVEAAVSGRSCHVERGGDQGDDLTYVGDCARAVLAAVVAPEGTSGSFNIATGRLATVRDFVEALTTVVPGADVSIGPGLNYAGETVSYRSVLDIGKATQVLGFEPAFDLEAGVADYVAYERESAASSVR